MFIFSPCSALSRARAFLPTLALADAQLKERMAAMTEEERREHLQVDHVGEGGEGDERRAVEMSVAVVEQEGGGWSEDSDPDSPASEPREGCGNGFTSDSDSDSTIRYETTVTRA